MTNQVKKIPKPITQIRLKNIALFYISKYECSAEMLRRVLNKRIYQTKIKGGSVPEQSTDWVHQIVTEIVNKGYVDDKRYAENLIYKLQSTGKSLRTVINKLKTAGISDEIISELTTDELKSDIEQAIRLVQKKKLGYLRPVEQRKEYFKKDLGVLARAGFSYDTAIKALQLSEDEQDEFNANYF
ncbi:MAG: RecX family transcriptional regulator [Alphaproteobacteria bacterium]|nr:RecX family transcriptional regulator [Alphaproteobacteria bacterium]